MTKRPPVTCHVLDTTTGLPARNVLCSIYKVELASSVTFIHGEELDELKPAHPFAMAYTDEDGRVPKWTFNPDSSQRGFLEEIGIKSKDSGSLEWEKLTYGSYKIRFQVGKYYRSQGQTNFHPYIEILFKVDDSRHYHIPLLLSNYGYTTYRGS